MSAHTATRSTAATVPSSTATAHQGPPLVQQPGIPVTQYNGRSRVHGEAAPRRLTLPAQLAAGRRRMVPTARTSSS